VFTSIEWLIPLRWRWLRRPLDIYKGVCQNQMRYLVGVRA
jgi:hypothetical protein